MNEELKSKNKYVYEIIDNSVDDTEKFIVKGNIRPKDMEILIFYLQYEFQKILDEATLIPYDIENILVKYYGFEELEYEDDMKIDSTIDLIDNIQNNIKKVSSRELEIDREKYYVTGILDDMKDIMIDIVYNNPDIFFQKFLDLTIEKDGVTYFPISNRFLNEVKSYIEKN